MLIDNCYVAVFQEETAAAVYNALSAVTVAMVLILSTAAVGIKRGIREIDMTLWQPVRVRHFGPRRRTEKHV